MKTLLAMTDIGSLLSSKESALHSKQLNEQLDAALARVQNQIRKGLARDAYAIAQQETRALQSAKLVIRTVALAHTV